VKSVHVIVSGRVQGVSFRAATERAAGNLGVHGWVRNREDGRVEAVFEGRDRDVDKIVAWCRTGPPGARVDDIVIEEEPSAARHHGFRVVY